MVRSVMRSVFKLFVIEKTEKERRMNFGWFEVYRFFCCEPLFFVSERQ